MRNRPDESGRGVLEQNLRRPEPKIHLRNMHKLPLHRILPGRLEQIRQPLRPLHELTVLCVLPQVSTDEQVRYQCGSGYIRSTTWANELPTLPTEEHGLDRVGCDISHHFPYTYSFSDGMRNSLKIRRVAILPALAQPIGSVNSFFDPTVKARMFPLMRTPRMSVLHRIVVNIIHMPGKILLIANEMLPEPPLPNAVLAPFHS